MPETQNFDPVGFKRIHDLFRIRMSRFRKCAEYLEPLTKPCYESLRPHGIFRDKISDFDKVRFCARRLIQSPTEPLLQAFHNVFQRIFRFVFRGPDSLVHSRKEFGAFFNILSVKPDP